MKKYIVTGMSCAACSAKVEKAVKSIEGVTSCSVNLLTNSMGVEGDVAADTIIEAVCKAGYGAREVGSSNASGKISDATKISNNSNNSMSVGSTKETIGNVSSMSLYEDMLQDKDTPVLKRRLIYSVGFLVVLMYFSMGHMMWDFPIPRYFEENVLAQGLLQLLLTTIVMVINQKFFINGYKGLIRMSPNMDTLVALGSTAAYVYSVYALFAMTDAAVMGDIDKAHSYIHEMYFESAAMILTLITVGKMLEARSKGKTTDALKSLIKLAPKSATVLRDGIEKQVRVEEVNIGDIFIVKSGESIPTDGKVIDGTGAVNESALTGESIPVDKKISDKVSAATICEYGYMKCQATRVGEDTALSQIIQMVSDAAATKAPIAKIADKVAGIFVPVVIGIAIITFIIWMFVGETVGYALARAISVLVISCPCALGLATPVAIMVGNGVGARNGILYKTAEAIETVGKVNIVALDKTGTITTGEMAVTDIYADDGIDIEEFKRKAYSLEKLSEHPLAKAVVKMYESKNKGGISSAASNNAYDVKDFMVHPGNGIYGKIDGEEIWAGNKRFISDIIDIPDKFKANSDTMAMEGKTPIYVATKTRILGIIAIADTIKKDSKEAIRQLKDMGIKVIMLTGDNSKTANHIGKEAGVDEVVAEVLPDGKEEVIRKLKEEGIVAMVGDGINDAPALTRADMGIAIGAGTEVAIDAADIVLMKSKLMDVAEAIRLSRRTIRNIKQNLFWAFFYNAIGIPLAAGAFIQIFGWELNPMFGAFAMGLSSFCVVTNALRLNKNTKKEEEKSMTKTIKIEGMMCKHCEANVKKILEGFQAVDEAIVSHEAGTAVVTLNAEISDEVLVKAIEDNDYKVISVE